ncbi:vesicle-associated membrane protein 8-like [Oppia nitens]|uniref:vesicle-associated membrane protein 8-like n=1 Tax=Oppia nitens TaxID=1686743 RepID=UPI0023DC4D4F|nr:vesicle-associated membrane protein 8-like [Oppia nitens]
MSHNRQYTDDFTSVNVDSDDNVSAQSPQSSSDPKIQKLKQHVNEVSNIMQQNIDKILERGQRLDHLEDRSEMLSNRADEFRVGARRVSRKMWWQNTRVNIFIAIVVTVIILIIVLSITSSTTGK